MLRLPNHCWYLSLICSFSCWCPGCGVPPAENSTPQATVSDSEETVSEKADSEKAVETAEKPAPAAAQAEPTGNETPPEKPAVTEEKSEASQTRPPEANETSDPINNSDSNQPSEDESSDPPLDPTEEEFVEPPPLPPPVGAAAMPEPNRVWIDTEKKTVIVDGYISLQEGMLEMFACPVGTKEHESIVAVYSSAQVVHAALLAVGAKVGSPVQFDPEFKPASGTEIAIEVRWQDKAGDWQSIAAQQLITDIKTNKPMTHPWVFAGSGFYKDEETGEEFYMAESGDFICVSNFSTATLDIPAESSQVNDGLLFEANGDKVPPLWTPVRLVLTPLFDKQKTD